MTAKTSSSTRAEVTADFLCLHVKPIRGLSPLHQHALHAFKHKIVAAMHELYQTIPTEKADPILKLYFKDPPIPPARLKKAIEKLHPGK